MELWDGQVRLVAPKKEKAKVPWFKLGQW